MGRGGFGGGHSGGGGGFSGGGHSHGGGSFGGHSGGFGGGHSGGNFGGHGGGGFGGGHPGGGFGGGHPGGGFGGGHGGGPRRYYGSGGTGAGCGTVFSFVIAIVIIVSVLRACITTCAFIPFVGCVDADCDSYAVSCSSSSSGSLTANTEKREKMDRKYLNYSDTWYTDELGWFGMNDSTLVEGLEDFYESTGVQPYVYMLSYDSSYFVDGEETTAADARTAKAEELYSELFTDEGHFLWVYFACENDSVDDMTGCYEYIIGYDAEIVLDTEAKDIFETRLQYYYDDDSLDVDEFIAKTFTKSGEAMMSDPSNKATAIIVVVSVLGGVAVIVLVIVFWRLRKKQKNKEQEELERILNKPLETFGSSETDDLKRKYGATGSDGDDNSGNGGNSGNAGNSGSSGTNASGNSADDLSNRSRSNYKE